MGVVQKSRHEEADVPQLAKSSDALPTVGVYPDNPNRFPTPEKLTEKLRRVRELLDYTPKLLEPGDDSYIERERVKTAKRLDEYFQRHGKDVLRSMEKSANSTHLTPIRIALDNPHGLRICDMLPGRGPITEADLVSGERRDAALKNWATGKAVQSFMNAARGNTFLLSDSDITIASSFDAARLALDDISARDKMDYRIGVVVLDSHADAYSAGSICKANTLGFALGEVARGYEENVLSVTPSVEYAGVVGLNSVTAMSVMNPTTSALFQRDRLSIHEDSRYYEGNDLNPEKLYAVGRSIVDRMLATDGSGRYERKQVTHLLFHVDVDVLPRTDHHGFEYNVLELLSRRKHVGEDDDLRQRREYLAVAGALDGIEHHQMRGIPGNTVLEFMKRTGDYARKKGVEIGVPLPHGRLICNIGEYVPEWDTGSVRDFVIRLVRFMDTQANRLYPGKQVV